MARLALAGSRTDTLRSVFTTASSVLTSVTLLAAATVMAVPELGPSHGGSDTWNAYSSDLIAQPGLRPGVAITLLLVAVPMLALAGQSVRFGSPARDRRLAAVRLAGATPGQVLGTVGVEGLILTVTGVFFGTVAGLAGILPFTMVRTDSAWPHQGLGIWLAIVAVAAAVTLGTSLYTARRALRAPAVAAVSLAA